MAGKEEVSTSDREMPDFKTPTTDQVRLHLRTLRAFDENIHLHQPHILHNAIRLGFSLKIKKISRNAYHTDGLFIFLLLMFKIRRYETCWLPLLAKYGQGEEAEKLVPPLDVAWIWHVHMLAPVKYHKDCAKITGMKMI